eukprot:3067340-Pleurochrysis_carterae.AAC.1
MRGFPVLYLLFYSFWLPPTLLHTAAAAHARERAAPAPLGRATAFVAPLAPSRTVSAPVQLVAPHPRSRNYFPINFHTLSTTHDAG